MTKTELMASDKLGPDWERLTRMRDLLLMITVQEELSLLNFSVLADMADEFAKSVRTISRHVGDEDG